jgi:hypothetical protein
MGVPKEETGSKKNYCLPFLEVIPLLLLLGKLQYSA